MKSEVLARSPVVIAAVATVVALIGIGRDAVVPGADAGGAVVTTSVPAAADVPLIGELTVTAERG